MKGVSDTDAAEKATKLVCVPFHKLNYLRRRGCSLEWERERKKIGSNYRRSVSEKIITGTRCTREKER